MLAFWVNDKQLGRATGYLPAKDQGRAAAHTATAEGDIMRLLDREQGLADIVRGLKHVTHRTQAQLLGAPIQIAPQTVEQLLCRAEVAGGEDHEDPVIGRLDQMELAIGADVVDAR